MSLVSCFVGKLTNATRASNLEYELGQVTEQLNNITQLASALESRISQADMNESMIMNQMFMMQSQQGFQQSRYPGRQGQQMYRGGPEQFLFSHLLNRHRKAQLEMQKRALHEYENQLQKKKMTLETQKKMADQNLESMQKMEEGAIKRFKINV